MPRTGMIPKLLPTLALLVLLLSPGRAEIFVIEAGDEECEVKFVSKAPMETVEGKTHQVSGSIDADLADLASGVKVRVEVDLASIDTGIGLRNKHMCENHLETDEYPTAVFVGTQVKDAPPAGVKPGESVDFTIQGEFTLHGVTRDLSAPVELSYGADGELYIETHFEVKLADYEIKRPKFLVMKLDEIQRVSLTLRALPSR